eukprot:6211198-Pleurochrysis_carterae.AAC.1
MHHGRGSKLQGERDAVMSAVAQRQHGGALGGAERPDCLVGGQRSHAPCVLGSSDRNHESIGQFVSFKVLDSVLRARCSDVAMFRVARAQLSAITLQQLVCSA